MNENYNLGEKVVSDLQKDFKLVGKSRIHGWYAWAIVGIVFGMALGIVYVANRSGQLSEIQAASSNGIPDRITLSVTGNVPAGTDIYAAVSKMGPQNKLIWFGSDQVFWSRKTDDKIVSGVKKYTLEALGKNTTVQDSETDDLIGAGASYGVVGVAPDGAVYLSDFKKGKNISVTMDGTRSVANVLTQKSNFKITLSRLAENDTKVRDLSLTTSGYSPTSVEVPLLPAVITQYQWWQTVPIQGDRISIPGGLPTSIYVNASAVDEAIPDFFGEIILPALPNGSLEFVLYDALGAFDEAHQYDSQKAYDNAYDRFVSNDLKEVVFTPDSASDGSPMTFRPETRNNPITATVDNAVAGPSANPHLTIQLISKNPIALKSGFYHVGDIIIKNTTSDKSSVIVKGLTLSVKSPVIEDRKKEWPIFRGMAAWETASWETTPGKGKLSPCDLPTLTTPDTCFATFRFNTKIAAGKQKKIPILIKKTSLITGSQYQFKIDALRPPVYLTQKGKVKGLFIQAPSNIPTTQIDVKP